MGRAGGATHALPGPGRPERPVLAPKPAAVRGGSKGRWQGVGQPRARRSRPPSRGLQPDGRSMVTARRRPDQGIRVAPGIWGISCNTNVCLHFQAGGPDAKFLGWTGRRTSGAPPSASAPELQGWMPVRLVAGSAVTADPERRPPQAERHRDLVWELARADDDGARMLLHLEFQAQRDDDMSERMFLYALRMSPGLQDLEVCGVVVHTGVDRFGEWWSPVQAVAGVRRYGFQTGELLEIHDHFFEEQGQCVGVCAGRMGPP